MSGIVVPVAGPVMSKPMRHIMGIHQGNSTGGSPTPNLSNPVTGTIELLGLFRRYIGRRLYVVFILSLMAALTEGIGIALLVPFLSVLDSSGVAEANMPESLRRIVDALGVAGSMPKILACIGLAMLLKSAIQVTNQMYGLWLTTSLRRELKARVFDAYATMTYRYYARHSTGHFLNVLGTQVGGLISAFGQLKAFVIRLIQATAYLFVVMMLTWQFGLLAIAMGGLMYLLFRKLNNYVRELSRETSLETSQLNKQLVQSLQAFKYLRSTNMMGGLRQRVMASIDRVTDHVHKKSMWGIVTEQVAEPVTIILVIAVISVQVFLLQEPLAPILVALVVFQRALRTVVGIQGAWQKTLQGVGAIEMVEDELGALAANREPDGDVELGTLRYGIELDRVLFAYDESTGDVLKDVSITIPVRTTVALVGESGSGKSTLVDILTLLLRPRAGEVRIDGVPGNRVRLASWRSQIGYVAQDSVIFDETIAANIAMQDVEPGDETMMARIRRAARRAHIAHFIEKLPDGYFTIVGDRGIRMSGGQRQRLAIARELFKEPSVLILDEATSSLDSRSEQRIRASIDALRGQMTVVIIAHRLSTIRNVDRVYVLDGGRVVEEGGYDELRHRSGSRFSRMVQLQEV